MSITDELRDAVGAAFMVGETKERLLAIVDRIDEEQESQRQAEFINGYRKALEEVKEAYVKLPVDADGVPIHVGDELTDGFGLKPAKVKCILFNSDGWSVSPRDPSGVWAEPTNLRHAKPDSWERIIEDACERAVRCDKGGYDCGTNDLVERCRRLAGE